MSIGDMSTGIKGSTSSDFMYIAVILLADTNIIYLYGTTGAYS